MCSHFIAAQEVTQLIKAICFPNLCYIATHSHRQKSACNFVTKGLKIKCEHVFLEQYSRSVKADTDNATRRDATRRDFYKRAGDKSYSKNTFFNQ